VIAKFIFKSTNSKDFPRCKVSCNLRKGSEKLRNTKKDDFRELEKLKETEQKDLSQSSTRKRGDKKEYKLNSSKIGPGKKRFSSVVGQDKRTIESDIK